MSSQSRPEPTAGASRRSLLRGAGSAGAGELDIVSGTSHTVPRDLALAARLTSAVR
jgi:hypothetical protein